MAFESSHMADEAQGGVGIMFASLQVGISYGDPS